MKDSKKPRIAYCIPALYNSGGMERVLSVKANYLAKRGYEIHIITTDQMGRPVHFPLVDGIQLHHLDFDYEGSNGSLLGKLKAEVLSTARHKKALAALLERIQPDFTVSMFGHEAPFLPSIKAGGRKVLEYHFCKLKRLQYGRKGLWGLLDRLYTYLDERTVRRYDEFVVLTEEDRNLWGDVGNIRVIPNPKPFRSEICSAGYTPQVVAAGRYCHQKNFESLIRIWSRVQADFPEWHCPPYAAGAGRSALEVLIAELGLERSVQLNPPTSNMTLVYMQSSVYAMTSRYEGLPMVLIEAQTMGLPIVSYACLCGPRDIITEGKDGFLVEMGDEEGFAQRLRQLMADTALRQEMGRAATKSSQRYELERIMQAWEELFGEDKRN